MIYPCLWWLSNICHHQALWTIYRPSITQRKPSIKQKFIINEPLIHHQCIMISLSINYWPSLKHQTSLQHWPSTDHYLSKLTTNNHHLNYQLTIDQASHPLTIDQACHPLTIDQPFHPSTIDSLWPQDPPTSCSRAVRPKGFKRRRGGGWFMGLGR